MIDQTAYASRQGVLKHYSAKRWALVPAAYVGMTVVLPLANGAWRRFGAIYVEHAITVVLVAACMCGLGLLRAASPPRRR